MSEESTEVVRTVATVSVHPEAIPSKADAEHLARMNVHCERTAETLREVAHLASMVKEALHKVDVSQPPSANDAMMSYALIRIHKIIRMADAAGKANDVITGSGKGKKGV
jgi:hypothetical protein